MQRAAWSTQCTREEYVVWEKRVHRCPHSQLSYQKTHRRLSGAENISILFPSVFFLFEQLLFHFQSWPKETGSFTLMVGSEARRGGIPFSVRRKFWCLVRDSIRQADFAILQSGEPDIGEVHFTVPCNPAKQGPPAAGTAASCRWRCQQWRPSMSVTWPQHRPNRSALGL